MRKMIFTLVLAMVSSVWMTSKAMCQVDACTCLFDDPPVAISGILQLVPLPCPESTEDIPCPPCLTIALNANEQLYYLNVWNDNLNALLDTLVYPVNATVTGHVYPAVEDGLAIRVQDISLHASLPSLCDEWNVLHEPFSCDGIYCRLQTLIYRLTTDTLIQDVNYVKLMEQEGSNTYYKGAMREGTNRDIYYVPANSTHEYLLYAFNAQVGDELENVWLGGETEKEDCTNAHNATIIAISDSNPRIFTLEIIPFTSYEGMEVYPYWMEWIEGVGMSDGPVGAYDSNKLCPSAADLGVFTLLCSYKNGEQVYVSDMGEQYGCVYNYDPYAPSDTIPLFSYTGDDPGSSTVDPVDPNQVVATLQGDQLTIHEHSGVDVTYTLRHNAPAQMPSLHRAPQSDTFRDMVTLQITESGEYMLLLTNPSWGYSIFGRFNYMPQGVESVHSSSAPQKVLQNGQMIILRGEKMYTVTGQEVR